MNCRKAHVLMSCAIDGELSAKEEREFLEHLSLCSACASEFEEAKKTKMIIKEKLVRFKAPQSLVESVRKLGLLSNPQTKKNRLQDQFS